MIRLLQGDEACAEGAIAAGCRFFAGYPITPATEIAEVMARRLPQVGGVFIQMEDEIASIAAVIGAAVGGAKSMTATSGPGFSLMQENLGYAVMAEIPCVIVDVQRLGPSTGRPTRPSQGDVMQARWGTHGDHPIIALCPSSVQETFDLTIRAFNLAEQYRTPVVLLLDEVIGHMREGVDLPDYETVERVERGETLVPPEWYKPFENVPTNIPPLIPFGEGYRYHITGLYHDERGYPTERVEEIEPWLERVFGKIQQGLSEILLYDMDGIEDAEVLVIAYGVTARSARHAVRYARKRGRRVGFLKLKTLWPFPEEVVTEAAARVDRVIVPELNLGQLVLEVERVVGREKVHRINQATGELIQPEEILRSIEGWDTA
ncbi:MAG TPA: 2-oxoacid:acceptor oxidoreductase subunit alpha [Anaerolineales bacterium]|nr:2-oxoacid:acceptor oxidoreductase subunit alpha [Anaerolineae bacterium]HIP87216.1 2-oxoacid:acceptor oxidoreductase subunit alpha [Anaerolineales bacterium]